MERSRKVVGSRLSSIMPDRRTRLRDLSDLPSDKRTPNTKELQFFSSKDNIGNYLPVLGIQNMIGYEPDAWNVWDKHIDYDFINQTYRSVIIGGAGLLHSSFEPFWREFMERCSLPAIIWGVGICVPDVSKSPGVSRDLLRRARGRFDLVNLRDTLTADWYGWEDVSVTACPAFAYLELRDPGQGRSGILYSHHPGLAEPNEIEVMSELLKGFGIVDVTDNRQTRRLSVADIVDSYEGRHAVVATRLHGAIIAAALGRRYVALARDEKLRAFQKEFGNGLLAEDSDDLPELVADAREGSVDLAPLLREIRAFGQEARSWLATTT